MAVFPCMSLFIKDAATGKPICRKIMLPYLNLHLWLHPYEVHIFLDKLLYLPKIRIHLTNGNKNDHLCASTPWIYCLCQPRHQLQASKHILFFQNGLKMRMKNWNNGMSASWSHMWLRNSKAMLEQGHVIHIVDSSFARCCWVAKDGSKPQWRSSIGSWCIVVICGDMQCPYTSDLGYSNVPISSFFPPVILSVFPWTSQRPWILHKAMTNQLRNLSLGCVSLVSSQIRQFQRVIFVE